MGASSSAPAAAEKEQKKEEPEESSEEEGGLMGLFDWTIVFWLSIVVNVFPLFDATYAIINGFSELGMVQLIRSVCDIS